jgi:hypothetical protein
MRQYDKQNCPRCGLENAPFGRNKARANGLAIYCLMCMNEYRLDYIAKGTYQRDWKEYNKMRRARPGYYEVERKQADERDKIRRRTDPDYVWKRSESNRKWKKSGDAEKKRENANRRKREARKRKRDELIAADPTFLERMRENQRLGRLRFNPNGPL